MCLKDKVKRFSILIVIGIAFPYLVNTFSDQSQSQDKQASSTAYKFWSSPGYRFAAAFPGEVERVAVEGRDGDTIGYFSVEKTSQGGTVYQISHYMLPPQLEDVGSRRALRALLAEKSRMIELTVPLETEWHPFGKDNESLYYQQSFEEQGFKVRERGFILNHQGEVFEVKTQSTLPESQQVDQNIEQFLDSFVIFTQ